MAGSGPDPLVGVDAGGAAPTEHGARRLVVLTGPSGVGKTTVCHRVVELARRGERRVAGLLSESSGVSPGRVVQTVVSLRTGERRLLAERVGCDEGEPIAAGAAGRLAWRFDAGGVRWGHRELARCRGRKVDLLVVDQLGPLELTIGSGWSNALDAVTSTPVALALVVVNPLVLEELLGRLGFRGVVVIEVNEANRDILPGCLAHAAGWEIVKRSPEATTAADLR